MALPPVVETETNAGDIVARGQTIDRFVVLGLVGRGGMSEVYAAYDPKLDRKVAIKLLRANDAPKDQRQRLLREAQAIAKLQHPNVVVVFDVGTYRESLFLAMEYVDGRTVGAWLKASPRTPRRILEVYLAAGRGLAAAHAAGLVHRDFKPDNVMVTRDGQVRVMDFGLATEARRGGDSAAVPTGTIARTMMGTPAYMAPEQFAGGPTDARTDQFAFCVSLHEALTGERPFAGETVLGIMTSVAAGEISPALAKSGVPSWRRKVLLRGLATDPNARYPSMNALLAALHTDPTARPRRLAAAGLAVAAFSVALWGAGHRRTAAPVDRCSGGAERLATAWDPPGAPSRRRGAVERAFQGTRDSFAAQAFAAVSRYLDDYGAAWLGAYRDACEATHVRREQSSDVLDMRMGCLNDRLVELRALTDELATANGKVVQNAVPGVSSLVPLARCADVRLLRNVVRPPSDPSTRARVEALQTQKAKLFASTLSGRCEKVRAIEKDVIAGARQVTYPPLLAEVLLASGKVEDTCGGRAETLVRRYHEALTVALSAGHDQVAAEGAALLASTLADRERQLVAARQWHQMGEAIVSRMGGTPFLQIALDQAAGIIAQREHDGVASLAALEKARLATIKFRGAAHPYVGLILNAEGLSLHYAGKDAEALGVLRDAEVIFWNVVGPDHPWAATALANKGEVLNGLHRWGEARAAFQMATAIWTNQEAEPARLASCQTGIGLAYLGEGRPLDAIGPLEQALAARDQKTTPPELVGETRFALARAMWSKPAERPRALALARAARQDYSGVANGERAVAAIDDWLTGRR
jgi:tRNA A-37 threonylcarbamoyl transferase component Bud32/tetratricopeptide (TPR) repeat protein